VERFCGTYDYNLDSKGRLILPAPLRGAFETKRAVVSHYLERCLAIWTPELFDHYLAAAELMEVYGQEGRNLARSLSAHSSEVEFDGQWRVTVPPAMRNYAELEPDQPVTVVGANNRVELWRPSRWKEKDAKSEQELADGTSQLFLLLSRALNPSPQGVGWAGPGPSPPGLITSPWPAATQAPQPVAPQPVAPQPVVSQPPVPQPGEPSP
jgi:MraZ protein